MRADSPVPFRRLAGASLCLLAAACGKDAKPEGQATGAAAAATPGWVAYVTNEDSNELTIIDTGTDSVLATVAVGTRPRGVKVTRDGKTVFVALSGSPKCPPSMPDAECEKLKVDKSKDGIAVIDAATRTVRKVLPGGSDPEAFDISANGRLLYVSNEDAGVASIIEIDSDSVRATVQTGREPEGVTVSPDGKTVWITGETDHDLTVLDAETGMKATSVVVGKRPRGIAFLPNGTRAYSTNEAEGTLSVIDVASRKVIGTIKLPGEAKPMGIVASPDGKALYVSTGRAGTVVAIDPAGDSVTGSVTVGKRPWGIALTPDGRKLYSANGPSNDVSVVDLKTMTVVKSIPAGSVPWGVAIGPRP
jgi:PQQ-dependent catabolism-associated beta-propeller protein